MRRIVFIIFIVTVTNQLQAQYAEPAINYCELDSSCTGDPTYKFFEKEQLKAYCRTEAGNRFLSFMLNRSFLDSVFQATDSSFSKCPNSLGFAGAGMRDDARQLAKSAFTAKLPTCYEDPFIYRLLTWIVGEMERARKQLKMPLKIPPVYGSLPTSSVNAYTFPPDTAAENVHKRGSVIGFNTLLFMFAYQMTKVTLPTIAISKTGAKNRVAVDLSRDGAIKIVRNNPELRINFLIALLEFLQLAYQHTRPLDWKYQEDLSTFATSMEMFAVAHEYGHLIRGHVLTGTKSLQLSFSASPGKGASIVGVHSWKQELEADEVGVKLLIQALKNQIKDKKDASATQSRKVRHLFSLYAPLFYFKASDIVERTRHLYETGALPPKLTREETAFIHALANGKANLRDTTKFSNLHFTDHPPGWLRAERVSRQIQAYMDKNRFPAETVAHAKIGKGILENFEILWHLSLPRLPYLLEMLRTKAVPKKVSYIPVPEFWEETFLYNPELQRALLAFYDQASDAAIIATYYNALQTDWILLSGIQVKWAKEVLTLNEQAIDPRAALAVLALSGDKKAIPFLKGLDDSKWPMEMRGLLQRTVLFLERNGKETSIAALGNIPATEFTLHSLLTFPGSPEAGYLEQLIPGAANEEVTGLLIRNTGIPSGGSLSVTALCILFAKKGDGYVYDIMADFLLREGWCDAALDFALTGSKRSPQYPQILNTIGNIFSQRGALKSANNYYEKSIKMGRNDGWPEINMAKNYSALNDLKNAEKWFSKGIKRQSTVKSAEEYAEYLNEYAWFLVKKYPRDTARMGDALAYCLVSNELTNYANAAYLYTMAECLAAIGLYEEALKAADSARKLTDKNSAEYLQYGKRLSEFKSKQIPHSAGTSR